MDTLENKYTKEELKKIERIIEKGRKRAKKVKSSSELSKYIKSI